MSLPEICSVLPWKRRIYHCFSVLLLQTFLAVKQEFGLVMGHLLRKCVISCPPVGFEGNH